MLTKFHISNFGIFDKTEFDLSKGLTIITGETGAGKSLFINALGLISGKRADTSFVRNKKEKSVIEAHFVSISENLLKRYLSEGTSPTVLRREIYPSGKSKSFINNHPVSLEKFGKLARKLVDIHGQYDHQLIADVRYQLKFLDAYCKNESLLKKYQHHFQEYKSLQEQIHLLKEQRENHLIHQEYKDFLLLELQRAKITHNEEKELHKKAHQLTHAEKTAMWLSEGLHLLEREEEGVLSQLARLKNALEKSSELCGEHHELAQRVHAVWIEMNDLYNEIIDWTEATESEPIPLEAIQQRLDLLAQLKKKHQVTSLEELLKVQEKLEKESQEANNMLFDLESLQKQEHLLRNDLEKEQKKLSDKRKESIPKIEQLINELLCTLEMPEAMLKIQLLALEEPHKIGAENIQILFSANKGSPLKELGSTASGGERSRLMLAIKSLADIQEYVPTLILDEIDTGVSGRIADKVGDLLKKMANKRQIIAITHLPQVAAKGQKHLKVYKTKIDSKTTALLKELNEKEQIEEIAEMISGTTVTQAARLQAQALLASGKEVSV